MIFTTRHHCHGSFLCCAQIGSLKAASVAGGWGASESFSAQLRSWHARCSVSQQLVLYSPQGRGERRHHRRHPGLLPHEMPQQVQSLCILTGPLLHWPHQRDPQATTRFITLGTNHLNGHSNLENRKICVKEALKFMQTLNARQRLKWKYIGSPIPL